MQFDLLHVEAYLVTGEIGTGKGTVPIQGAVISFDEPRDPDVRRSALFVNRILSNQAWDALVLYWYSPRPLAHGDLQSCLNGCWEDMFHDMDRCRDDRKLCKLKLGTGTLIGCAMDPLVGVCTLGAGILYCEIDYDRCLEDADYDFWHCTDRCKDTYGDGLPKLPGEESP